MGANLCEAGGIFDCACRAVPLTLFSLNEIMTTSSNDFRERMTEEITGFIQNQARSLSLADIKRLIADLPVLR